MGYEGLSGDGKGQVEVTHTEWTDHARSLPYEQLFVVGYFVEPAALAAWRTTCRDMCTSVAVSYAKRIIEMRGEDPVVVAERCLANAEDQVRQHRGMTLRELKYARLHVRRDSTPREAANAMLLIKFASIDTSFPEVVDAVRATIRSLRDFVVLRCHANITIGDREAFVEAAELAFEGNLDIINMSELLLSYHVMMRKKMFRFL